MKYKLTTSIFAKCRLLTPKVNFVVTIALCCALRAVYFITQRAEAPKGATQRTLLYEGGIRDLGNYGLRDLNSPLSASVVRKNLCAAIIDCSLLSA